jgi:hypothetical protein
MLLNTFSERHIPTRIKAKRQLQTRFSPRKGVQGTLGSRATGFWWLFF